MWCCTMVKSEKSKVWSKLHRRCVNMITWQAQIRKKSNILLDSEGKFMMNVVSGHTLLAIYIFTHSKKFRLKPSHHKLHWAFIVLNMFKTKTKIYEERLKRSGADRLASGYLWGSRVSAGMTPSPHSSSSAGGHYLRPPSMDHMCLLF